MLSHGQRTAMRADDLVCEVAGDARGDVARGEQEVEA